MNQGKKSLAAILFGLLAFGAIYNEVVAHLEATGRDKGFRGAMVAPITITTIAAISPLIGRDAALTVLAAFVAVGILPIAGDAMRYADQREFSEEMLKNVLQEVLNYGDTA